MTEATIAEAAPAAPLPAEDPAAAARRARLRRLAPWLGLAGFLAVLGASTAIWGLPWSRDRMAIWVVAGLAAVSLADLKSWARGMLVDWAPLFAVLFTYDLLRGYADGLMSSAHVLPQLQFDEWLGGGTAPTVYLQQHFWTRTQPHWWDYAAWTVYTSHFFTAIIVAAVLWRVAHDRFRSFAAMFVSLTLVGYATYVLFPAVPPWMAAQQGYIPFVDRVVPNMWAHVGVQPAQMIFEGGNRYANDVAAMPSLHAAYPVLMLLFFWRAGWAVRGLLAAYALAMGTSLVYGGEHYVADILVGWVYAAAIFGAAVAIRRARARRRMPTIESVPQAAATSL